MEIKVNDIVRGKVSGIQPYGAFISLNDGITGLVHISEISSYFVKDITKFLTVGEEYSFLVIEIDNEKKNAKLSLKRITESKENRKKASLIEKQQTLNNYACYFDEIFKAVNIELDKDFSKVIVSKDTDLSKVDISKLSTAQLEVVEKDISDISDLKDITTLVVVTSLERKLLIQSIIELYCYKPQIDMIFIDYNDDYKELSCLSKYLAEKDFTVLFDCEKNLDKRNAILYRIFRKILEDNHHYNESSFIFVTQESGYDLQRLVNKENYSLFIQDNKLEDKYNLLSYLLLLVLHFNHLNITQFILGLRRGLVDIDERNLVKPLIKSERTLDNKHYLDQYLNLLNIHIKIGLEDNNLIAPIYKDYVQSLTNNESKNIKELLTNNIYDLIILNNDEFSLGYLFSLIIIASINK